MRATRARGTGISTRIAGARQGLPDIVSAGFVSTRAQHRTNQRTDSESIFSTKGHFEAALIGAHQRVVQLHMLLATDLDHRTGEGLLMLCMDYGSGRELLSQLTVSINS